MELKIYKVDWGEFNKVKNKRHNSVIYICHDNWDDFGYKTTYSIILFDENAELKDLGYVHISNMEYKNDIIDLDGEFFSMGSDIEYYKKISKLSPEIKNEFLKIMRDIVNDETILSKASDKDVFKVSFLRGTSMTDIKGQYKRVLNGGAELTDYEFGYEIINNDKSIELDFIVKKESTPPTNIHVIIGRNGVGKTHLLNGIANSFLEKNIYGKFYERQLFDKEEFNIKIFSKMINISFSVFDSSAPKESEEYKDRYTLVTLGQILENSYSDLKTDEKLARYFCKSFRFVQKMKSNEWDEIVKELYTDPVFKAKDIIFLKGEDDDEKIKLFFKSLSSGHSIVLLMLTKLIEKIGGEKNLVLLDEPESHLHPPLLSALMRALSTLLIKKNSVAIITTHSPVVLQEVPKNCVYLLSQTKAERLNIETFGESVSTLTRDVFGLEVIHSGFYSMLYKEVESGLNYDEILNKYKNQLGLEARLQLRSMINNKQQ